MPAIVIPAPISSNHAAPVSAGGTGATTAAAARTNLDVYSKSEVTNAISQSTALGGKQVQWGHLSLPSIAASGQTEITVTLPKSYNGGNDYMAVVTPVAYMAASYVNYIIRNKSSGSFVVRIYNGSTSAINDAYLDWITVGV